MSNCVLLFRGVSKQPPGVAVVMSNCVLLFRGVSKQPSGVAVEDDCDRVADHSLEPTAIAHAATLETAAQRHRR